MTKAVHSNITRRLILGSAAAVVSAAALPAAAFPLTANTAAGMTPIGRLWVQREIAVKDQHRAYAAQDAAEARWAATKPVLPDALKLTGLDLYHLYLGPGSSFVVCHGDPEFYTVAVENWRKLASKLDGNASSAIVERVRAKLAVAEQYDRESVADYDASGCEGAEVAANRAYDRVADIEDEIFAAPVTCAADLAIKAQIFGQRSKEGRDLPEDYVLSFAGEVQQFAAGLSVNGGVDA